MRDIIAITVIIVMGILVGVKVMPYNYFINIVTFILGFYFGYNIPTQISLYEYFMYVHEDLSNTNAEPKVLQDFGQSFAKFKHGFFLFMLIAVIDAMFVLLSDLRLISMNNYYAIIIIDIITYISAVISSYISDNADHMEHIIITHYGSPNNK